MSKKLLHIVKDIFSQFKHSICMYISLTKDITKEYVHIVYSCFTYIIHCTTFTNSLLKKAFFIVIFSICCLSYGYGKAFAETNLGGSKQQSQNNGPGDNSNSNEASGSTGNSSGSSGSSNENLFEDLNKKLQDRYKATHGNDSDDSDSDDYDDDDDDNDTSSINSSSSSSTRSSFDNARQHLKNFYGASNSGTSDASSSSSDSSDSDSDSSSDSSYKDLKRQHKQLQDRYEATTKVFILSGQNPLLGGILENIEQRIKEVEVKLAAATDTESNSDSDSDSDTDSDSDSDFDFDDDSDSDTDSTTDEDRDSDDEDTDSSDSDSDSDSDKEEGRDSSGDSSDNDDHTNEQDPGNTSNHQEHRDEGSNQNQNKTTDNSKFNNDFENADSCYSSDSGGYSSDGSDNSDSESDNSNNGNDKNPWKAYTVIFTEDGNGTDNNAPAPGAQPPQNNRAPGNQQPNNQVNGNNKDKKSHETTTQGYKQAVPKKQTPELEPTPPPGYSVVANKASLKALMNAIGGVIQETKGSLRMLTLQASSARLTPEKPFRVFASVTGGLKKDKKGREGSSQVGALFTIPQLHLPKLWHGVAYSYGKDQSKVHYGTDTSAVKALAQSKTDMHHLSFITAWNIAEPGVTGHVEGTIGWGQTKNSRSFTHAGNLTTAKGKTHTHTHGGTARIGYNIPITEHSILTPYAELASVSANWNPYKESGGTLPATISKTKQTTLERRIGVKNNWNITNTYKLQTWGAVISGKRQNSSGLSATLPASKIKTSSGKEKKQYTQGELGASLDVKVAKDFGVGLNAGIRTSESKKGLGSGNAGIRLWYDF